MPMIPMSQPTTQSGRRKSLQSSPRRRPSVGGATLASTACSTIPTLNSAEAVSAAASPTSTNASWLTVTIPRAPLAQQRSGGGQIWFLIRPGPARLPGGAASGTRMQYDKFAIGFDLRDRERLHALWDGILDEHLWSDGPLVRGFEETWGAWNGLPGVA